MIERRQRNINNPTETRKESSSVSGNSHVSKESRGSRHHHHIRHILPRSIRHMDYGEALMYGAGALLTGAIGYVYIEYKKATG